ncbi:PEP-CTERM sorting domain-containing protein [Inhella crocodyli]|uniref:PEP-CTERM sorting domain-containing protein n=1 Tax=Inhella crocodyli TaxID=2499851 RepID=A0A3S2XZG6_9BURK|nr:PEP-CTERM sorting domain-containing protein [Inhella crocodyli]RVT88373.1 PEP-CTERM sorting domain-containing protein [Inhella crocodyli]
MCLIVITTSCLVSNELGWHKKCLFFSDGWQFHLSAAFVLMRLIRQLRSFQPDHQMIKTLVLAFAALCTSFQASAAPVGVAGFDSPTLIDFNDAPSGLINTFYVGNGVKFVNLSGTYSYDTGTGSGASKSATNFFDVPGFPNGEALFSNLMVRAGFFITANDADDTTVYAYKGATLVGFETFNTSGNGVGGSFVGVEFTSGFDRIVIDTFGPVNGAFAIDDFRFEAASVPEPTSLALLGLGAAGFGFTRLRKK